MANELWKLPSIDYVNETANHRAANDKMSQSQAVKRAATFFWELTKMYIFKVVILLCYTCCKYPKGLFYDIQVLLYWRKKTRSKLVHWFSFKQMSQDQYRGTTVCWGCTVEKGWRRKRGLHRWVERGDPILGRPFQDRMLRGREKYRLHWQG